MSGSIEISWPQNWQLDLTIEQGPTLHLGYSSSVVGGDPTMTRLIAGTGGFEFRNAANTANLMTLSAVGVLNTASTITQNGSPVALASQLAGYVTSGALTAALANYTTTTALTTMLGAYATTASLAAYVSTTALAAAGGAALVGVAGGGNLQTQIDKISTLPATLNVGSGRFEQVGTETMLHQLTPSRRGELLLNPNDTGGPDLSAGGELTLMGYDVKQPGREFGAGGNQVVGALYMDRLEGVVQSVRLRVLSTGTEPVVPIRFDPTGGENTFELGTNAQSGRVWARNLIQVGGTISNPDTASSYDPTIRVGPGPGPVIDLDDSNSGSSIKWRWRNLDGVLAAVNVNAGQVPFQITASTQMVQITNLTVSGTVNMSSITASGSISGASLVIAGTVTTANVTATGTITGATVTATGGLNGASVTVTDLVQAGRLRGWTTGTGASARGGDLRNLSTGFTDNVLFVAHSNAVLDTGNLFGGYNLSAGTFQITIRDNGNIQNVNNSYGAISDERVKMNITSANSQWDDVKALGSSLKKYNLKSDPDGPLQLGAIAQDWEKISPGLIFEFDEIVEKRGKMVKTGRRLKGINYSIAQVKALGALAEALGRIEALEAAAKGA